MFVFLLDRKSAENFGLASDQTCSSSPIKSVGEDALAFQFQRDEEAELGYALHKGDWLFVGGPCTKGTVGAFFEFYSSVLGSLKDIWIPEGHLVRSSESPGPLRGSTSN